MVDGIISPHFFSIRIVEGWLFGNLVDIVYRATPIAIVALGMAIVLDIQPIIATLILMVSGRGIGLMINLIYGANPSFESPFLQGLSTGHIGLIPTRIFVGLGLGLALWALTRRTAFGLFLEAVGSNPRAARLAGVEARAIRFAAYLVCGFMAAAAGVILTADTHTSDPVSVGLYIELDAILAVVIGGGSLNGGRVYLAGAALGAVVIQALTTSILTSGLPPDYNLVVKAAAVLVVLLLQSANFRLAAAGFVRGRRR